MGAGLLLLGGCAPQAGGPSGSGASVLISPLPAQVPGSGPRTVVEAIAGDGAVRESWQVLLDDARDRQAWAVGIDAAFLGDDLRAYASRVASVLDPESPSFLGALPPEEADHALVATSLARRAAALARKVASKCQAQVRGPVPGPCARAVERLQRTMDDLLEYSDRVSRTAASVSPSPT